MLRTTYLILGLFFVLLFLLLVILAPHEISGRVVIGFTVLSVSLFGGYFRLKKEKETTESPVYQADLHVYDDVAPIGEASEKAESQMASVARCTKVEQQLRLFTRHGSRRFRIAYFEGQKADARVVSLDGRVVELEVFPKE